MSQQVQQMDRQLWDHLFTVIQRSFQIKKHVDFFMWLQESVRELLPHDVLVAAWGNFTAGQLRYDVASSIPEIRTQKILDGRDDLDLLMGDFFHRWQSVGERWYVINNFDALGINRQIPGSFLGNLGKMKSVLVYGIRDLRGKNDCLYVFFDQSDEFKVKLSLLGMLMPYIDATLRRVEYLGPDVQEDSAATEDQLANLSAREHEILHWIRLGKTNFEIGIILGISTNTVKNHLKRIFQKLDVSSRGQALAKYIAAGHT